MGSAKVKTQIYLVIISLIVSIMGVAYLKLEQSRPSVGAHRSVNTVKTLNSLEKMSSQSQSPEMSKFLRREKAAEESDQEASDALPK